MNTYCKKFKLAGFKANHSTSFGLREALYHLKPSSLSIFIHTEKEMEDEVLAQRAHKSHEEGVTVTTPLTGDGSSEYSLGRKVLTICWAFWGELTISLVITGWPAFLPVLVADGAYFELCSTYMPFFA